MVIRGRIRGNGRQLANYLLAEGENEHVLILDVDGKESANDNDLHQTLISMSLTSELTKSRKGLYHVQLNPAYGEDQAMTKEKWFLAAEILEKETGFVGQRRVIVLHTKKGRTHAHLVYQRFDHEKHVMKTDRFSRLAQDRARKAMEMALEHKPTPDRNPNRPEMKKVLTDLWKRCSTGQEFIREAAKAGYIVAKGLQRRPFMVVDSQGRSFDLVRQLENIRTKEVRQRLQDESLVSEKGAIDSVRSKQRLFETRNETTSKQKATNDNKAKEKTARLFAETRTDITQDDPLRGFGQRKKDMSEQFASNMEEAINIQEPVKDKAKEAAYAFMQNREDQLAKQKEHERLKNEFINSGKNKQKDKGYEPEL